MGECTQESRRCHGGGLAEHAVVGLWGCGSAGLWGCGAVGCAGWSRGGGRGGWVGGGSARRRLGRCSLPWSDQRRRGALDGGREVEATAQCCARNMSDVTRFANPLEKEVRNSDSEAAARSSLPEPGARARSLDTQVKQGRRSALTPECLEPESRLADPAANEDMFEQVLRAVRNKMTWQEKSDKFKLNPERDVFERRMVAPCLPKNSENKPDWEAPLSVDNLISILEGSLDHEFDNQLATLLKETGSGSELMEWWDVQSGVDTSSTDPFQIALAALEKGGMISPTASFRGNWDMLQALFLLYIAFSLPYRIGFDDNVILWSFWFWFDAALDIYFVIDICLNFKTAVITPEGEILYKQKDVTTNYLKGWFFIDFVSCLPVGYIEFMVGTDEGAPSSTRGVRLLRLFRLLKLLRLVRIKRILERWEEELYGNKSIRVGKMVFLVGVMSHWCCCGWFFSGDGSTEPDGTADGWVQKKFNDTTAVGSDDLYFASLFWSVMSIIKVQTGDPVYRAGQIAEQLMTLVSFLIGTFVTSVVIGQVADMIAHSNPAEKARTDAVGALHGFLHDNRIAPWLTRKIRAHFRNLYAVRGTASPVERYFVDLPMKMRKELAIELGFLHNYKTGKRGLLSKVPFCWDLTADDVIKICCKLQAQKFGIAQQAQQRRDKEKADDAPDTYIMREGDIGDEMFIITEGSVRIERAEEGGSVKNLGKLRELDFFGELAVLTIDENGRHFPRTRSAVCSSSVCMVQALNYASLQELRRQSSTIDAAVKAAEARIHAQRPSLRQRAGSAETTSTAERFQKLEELNAQVVGLQKEIAQQILDLKAAIGATS